jgi:hypothetical protein
MNAASHEKRCSWLAKCLIRFHRLEKFAFAGINPGDIKKHEDAFRYGMPYPCMALRFAVASR